MEKLAQRLHIKMAPFDPEGSRKMAYPFSRNDYFQLPILLSINEVTIRPAAGRILTKPGMMTFLVCFMRRLIRVICLLTRVS